MPRTPAEIMEALARGRRPFGGEYAIRDLRRDWEENNAATPFTDFIPIRLVTIIENSVREVVVQDHGQPCTSRGLSLLPSFQRRP